MTKEMVDDLWACVRRIDAAHLEICTHGYTMDQRLKPLLDAIAAALNEAQPKLAALRRSAPRIEAGKSGGRYYAQAEVPEEVMLTDHKAGARMVGRDIEKALLARFRAQEEIKSKPDPEDCGRLMGALSYRVGGVRDDG